MRRPVGLTLAALLLAGTGLAQTPPPPKKPPRTFTDEDLARYREERLRGELAGDEPTPPAAPGATPLPPTPKPPRTTASVEIRDINGTLPKETRAAAEAAGQRYAAFFRLAPDEPIVIPLRYFPDSAAFRDYLDRNLSLDLLVAGYYDPWKREIVVGNLDDTLVVLRHEIHHFVFDTAFHESPAWLREGLAEYFETASATADGLAVADQPRHRLQLAEWLRARRDPDLRELLALNRSAWTHQEYAGSARVRALSWSVVAFLMSSEPGRQAIHDFLASLKDQRGLYSLAAFDRSFPGGAAAFERQWLAWVEGRATAE